MKDSGSNEYFDSIVRFCLNVDKEMQEMGFFEAMESYASIGELDDLDGLEIAPDEFHGSDTMPCPPPEQE